MTPHPARRRTAVLTAALAATVTAACSSGPATTAPATTPPPAVATAPGGAPGPAAPPVLVTPPAVATGTPGQPRGATPTGVDRTDATAVAAAFAAATFTVDTALDRSRFDAQVRSAVWATPAYAAALTAPVPATGDAELTELAAHHGFTTVAVAPNSDDGRPTDQLRSAARSFTVTPTGHGDDGWAQPWPARTLYVFLARDGGDAPWQVASTQFTSVSAGAGQ